MQKHTLLLFAIIIVYLINGLLTIPKLSITSDEGSHLDYGLRFIQGDPNRYFAEKDNSKMPISVLNTIPRVIEQLKDKNLAKNDYGVSDAINGRYITLLFSVLTILIVFTWTNKLYGKDAAVFAAFLFSWCPNNLAAATLTTTDAYSTFFLVTTLYFLYNYCNKINTKNLIYFSVFIALSQLAKQSLFHLYPLCLLLIVAFFIYKRVKPNYKVIAKSVLIFALINFVILNAGFLFNKMFIPLGEYHFMSNAFIKLQSVLPNNLSVPFAKAFIEGLDMAKYYDQIGGGRTGVIESSFANVTILNKSSTGGSFWYFYFVTLWYKTPIPYLLLAIGALLINYKNRFVGFANAMFFLWLPLLYFVIILSFFYNTQCGVRHIIFIYPLLFIFSSQSINHFKSASSKFVLFLLSAWLVISVALYKGNYFSYTNEFILNKTFAYKKVGSNNLSFHQANNTLKDYLSKHKDTHYTPIAPAVGTFVLSVEDYLDVWNTKKYKWISHVEPIGNLANGAFLIIKVTAKDLLNTQ